jgi:hypothetical protein
MTRRRPLLALAAILVLALSACSRNNAKESDVVSAMTDAGLTQKQAECVGAAFEDEWGDHQETFNKIAAATSPDDFPEGTEEPINQILDRCVNGDGSSSSGSDSSDTTDTTGSDETTSTTAGSAG